MFFLALLIGVVVLATSWLVLRWFAEAQPRQIVNAGKWTVGVVGGGVAAWLLATGRLPLALLLSVGAPLFLRWRGLWSRLGNMRGPSSGGRSDVSSAWLRMSLDHDSGAMEGVIVQGPLRGQRLADLPLITLRELLGDLRVSDPDGAALLEAYLDRVHPEWREGEAPGPETPATPSAAMTIDEAWRVLGLEPGASHDAIRDAHRRLMKKLHPDQGGSSYLAAKINQAKDLLLTP